MNQKTPHIKIDNLEMKYGDLLIQKDLNFEIFRNEIFLVMGGSGCGKSTLLRHLIGLVEPAKGSIYYEDINFTKSSVDERTAIQMQMGVLYQSGALWSSMTLAENVALPIEQFTKYSKSDIKELVSLKLSLVGLAGYEKFYPSEISGGMRKRAGLARAMALDPEVLFFDEPSAGLDPISSRRLDDLIIELKESSKTTIVIVTHELASIFAIGDNSIFLDPESKTQIAGGNPNKLLQQCKNPKVQEFLTRGE